jgi:hypothetical protein
MGKRTTRPGATMPAINWPEAGEPAFPVRGWGLGWVDWWDDPELSTIVLRQTVARWKQERSRQIEQVRGGLNDAAAATD